MKLALTGLGVVSPIATGRAPFEAAFASADAAERAFAGTPTIASAEVVAGARVAEVWGFEPNAYLGTKGHRNFDRLTKLQIVAAKLALEDAGIKEAGAFRAYHPSRVGVCSATAYGSLDEITELNRVAELEDPRYINPTRFPNTVINSAAGYVSIWEDLRAPNTTLADGNTGALDGVLHAEVHLTARRADAMVVGGGEVVNDPVLLAVRRLGLFAHDGFGVGEGAAFAVLERPDDAVARGARVLAWVLGYGAAFRAPEREAVIVHADDATVERAVADALADAGVAADAIDLVISAESGVPLFDEAEARALARLFPHRPERLAPKRVLGESFGVAGALGIAVAVGPLRAAHTLAVVITVGYYGNVSAVVLGRPDAA